MKWIVSISVCVIAGIVCMSGISKSLGGGERDAVEAYYSDLVDKNSELKQVVREIQANDKNFYELEGRLNSYNRISNEYYGDANAKANGIHDATLKATVLGWITNSRTQQSERIAALTKLVGLLRDKKITQDDFHAAVKIAVTLPVVEKYQQQNLPTDAEYNKLMKDLEETVKKLQGMAKK